MIKDSLKIAVIGGGSSYTPELIEGLIEHYHEFPVKDLYLVDVEQGKEKLEIIGSLSRRMVERAGVPIRIHTTLDRKKAIKNANFVTTQIRVGQLEARSRDERIPLRYGCIGQETTGAGGFAKGLRTIPVILDICRDIEQLAPQAFLINFTNPAGMVTEAVLKYSDVRSIGLCNLPIGTKMQVAKIMDVDVSKVNIEIVGINHLNWAYNIQVNGIDVTWEVIEKFSKSRGLTVKNVPDLGWEPGFLESLGMLPCSYLRYYYLKDKMLEEQLQTLKTKGTRADTVKKVESELFELYKDPDLDIKPPQLEQRGGAYYSEAAINLMTSIYNNKRDIQAVNVKNNGIIPCLPHDASIEVNCVIGSDGASPVQLTQSVSPKVKGLLQVVKAYEELSVEAAVKGDYDCALHALTIHPLVGSSSVAKKILDDILEENKEYLPQFYS
ncbi:6-phospho-beta-glucosidase [Novibacillus thermophilus]|uniref:6-phospho-beta-glucosidase n=1 Tax=Novibacillus thermophilus TaxID=1471761 RepID=A0A1U9K4N6_9BACL|nr:6-phospho-beta-glucosidase [Novibacillus thermophilus]